MTGERLYSKAKTMERLEIGRHRYEQIIKSKLLPKPIVLAPGGRPVHTESQIHFYEQNIYRQALKDSQPASGQRMKPISDKLLSEI